MKSKPLVSFILLSYNQEKYISEAINSALKQSYSNIEFIISDDDSRDDTFKIIESVVKNHDRNVILNKNPINLGLVGNVNKAMSLSSGEIIVMAAGDDISLYDRVENSVFELENNKNISFLSFNDIKIDEEGHELGRLNKVIEKKIITIEQFLSGISSGFSGASRAFRRDVYTTFSSLNTECPTEDSPYLLRSLYIGNGMLMPNPGIMYRIHSQSLSSPNLIKMMNVDRIHEQYLDDLNVAINNKLISTHQYNMVLSWACYIRLEKLKTTSSLYRKAYYKACMLFNQIYMKKKINKIRCFLLSEGENEKL